MLTSAHTPEERGRVQGMNDFAVMGLRLRRLARLGRADELLGRRRGERLDAVNLAMAPLLAAAGGALIWLVLRRPRAVTSAR